MKQFIFFIMLLTAQSVCYAQSHPKVDSLFSYLKEIGMVKACEYNNFRQYGLLKRFSISQNVVPGIEKQESYVMPDGSNMSAEQLQMEKKKIHAIEYIRKTIAELTKDAIESHNFEFHEPCKDSIVSSLTLKKVSENGTPMDMPEGFDYKRSNQFGRIFFKYDMKPCKEGIYTAQWSLSYRVLLDMTSTAKSALNIESLMQILEPMFKDKKMTKRTIVVRYENDFKGYDDKVAIKKEYDFFNMPKPEYDGESNTLVCKFADEPSAKSVLKRVMDGVRHYIATNPNEAYTILSEDYFSDGYLTNLFSGGGIMPRKGNKLDIYSCKDSDGFYILVNFSRNCFNVPKDWRTLKKRIHGESENYKENW